MAAHILIVDDDAASILLLGQILVEIGDIVFCKSGPESLGLMQGRPPDIVLLDAEMPGMSGFDVCAVMKSMEKTRDIPVIFVTASSDADTETRALHTGAVDFIIKPFNPSVVRARVTTALTLARRTRARESRLMNMYRALSATNDTIIWVDKESELFPRVCRIAVDHGGMELAWIGVPDASGRFMPVACDGRASGYLDGNVVTSTSSQPEGRGHAGIAFRSMRPSIANDIREDEAAQPWREKNQQYGIRSVAAFPIARQHRAYAVLVVYSEAVNAFCNDIVGLLEEMTGNISFALDNFDREAERNRAEAALQHSESQFRQLADAMPQLVWTADSEGSADYFNQRQHEYHGFNQTETDKFDWSVVVHREDMDATERAWRQAVETGQLYQVEHRVKTADGSYRWHISRGIYTKNEQGEIVKWYGTSTDIHDLKLAQEALQRSEERLHLAQSVARIGAFEWNIPKNEIVWSSGEEELHGLVKGEFGGSYQEWVACVHPDDREKTELLVRDAMTSGVLDGEWRVQWQDGTVRWVAARGQVFRDTDGQPDRMIGINIDITEKKDSDDLIWSYANFDSLTGLPNRRLFRDRLEHEIYNARRTGAPLALLFLDLDGFKDVNDTLGHDMGDVLLKETARRLSRCVRESDTVARLGGDEFTVILPEMQDHGAAERIANHILKTLSEPIMLGNSLTHVAASMGITFYPYDATDIEDLLKSGDQAMYAAKQNGKNQYQYFTASMQEAAMARVRLINDLRGALESNQFEIVYQPIVELPSGKIYKAEALFRWHHPVRGLIKPVEFISTAEDTGLIVSFGNWVFHEAARQAAIWREKYHPDFQISINISPVQFKKEGIDTSIWFERLEKLGLSGKGIVVEITEGLLLDSTENVTNQLMKLRDAGIEVALDDFGTGYSSLSYLKKFDIDYIKIDQSFVKNLTAYSDDMVLCEAIIMMAHRLGIKVIAEGVETELQHELLANGCCNYAQGYLFSRPLPASKFEELLELDPFAIQEVLKI
jgi:diguanylate cyclase (GGDEF)-like protein/PAS domain S-box-containing protein